MSRAPDPRSKLASGDSIFTVMTRLTAEHGAINLSQGFPDFDCDPALVDAVAARMREGHNQYVAMAGVPELREALAAKIRHLYGRRYDPETEITVTSGATEALFSTILALVHSGDEVIVFEPVYDSYVPAIQLAGGTPVFVPLGARDYRIDWDDVRRAIGPKTRLLVLNSPHNPSGTILDWQDLQQLRQVLAGTDAYAVSDEVYEHIVFDGARHESLARDPDVSSRAVVISSFGKTYSTTGWKVGYAAAPAALTAEIRRVHQWVTYAVNGAVQLAYADVVRRDPECREVAAFYERKRNLFLGLLAGSKLVPLPCRGTFFQLMDYSRVTSEPDHAFAERLIAECGVAAIPLSPFLYTAEAGTTIRFCFAKRDETLEAAAGRLRRL
ncbi:MAG: aminotransferase class I/II-fold pyridoxal phosphate-dependent enzyme [Acidimicrobiia bacterium]|nr:aminotransferase class I/II-fold pyridoxal phosphate-dependent enzyme [Acidimicrobiia bacterium]